MRFFLLVAAQLVLGIGASAQAQVGCSYEIYAIEYAESAFRTPISSIAVGSNSPDSVRFGYFFWYLKGDNGRQILVDVGYIRDSARAGMSLSKYQRPDSALQRIGAAPGEITDVILTHPHFDHIGGIGLFEEATVWMQKNDYDYFVGGAWQKGGNHAGLDGRDVLEIVRANLDGRLRIVDGDSIEIIPGIRVFIGSRHTYESQHVLVNGKTRKVMLASDDAWFYCNLHELKPVPFCFDRNAYAGELARMKACVPDTDYIIPGHDSKVLENFPAVGIDVVRID